MHSKRQSEEGKQEAAMVRVEHEQQATDGGRETRSSHGKDRT
jgi:hypothetical protein